MDQQEGLGKGSLLVLLRERVREQQGPAGWEALLAALEPGDRAVLGGLVLEGGWYPLRTWNRAYAGAARLFGGAEPERHLRELAAYISGRDLNLLFRALLGLSSPRFIAARTPMIYDYYFRGGRFAAAQEVPGRWRLTLTGPADDTLTPGQATCSIGIPAWLDNALALNKTAGQAVHTACRFQGHPTCEYLMSWK